MILPADFNKETKEFVFPGLEGYALFEATVQDEEGIYNTVQSDLADGEFHVTTSDYGDSFQLSGTLYVGAETEDTVWKANHVYQTPEGMIYLDGSGNSYHGNEGGFSSKVEGTYTAAVNGEVGSVSTVVEFSVEQAEKLKKLLVHQYNEAGERIETQELTVTGEDKEVTWASGAAWAVVEEHYADMVKRTAYDYPVKAAEDVYHTVIILNMDGIGESYLIHFKK